MKLARQAEPVGRVARLQLRIQFMRGLEERHAKGSAVALKAMAQRSQRPVRIHPFAEICEDLFAGLIAVQRFELRPFGGLRLSDEVQHGLREDGPLAIKRLTSHALVPALKQVGFDYRLEGELGMAALTRHWTHWRAGNSARSRLLAGSGERCPP